MLRQLQYNRNLGHTPDFNKRQCGNSSQKKTEIWRSSEGARHTWVESFGKSVWVRVWILGNARKIP